MTTLYFHEEKNRLFVTFNYQLTVLEMKPELRDRIMSHEKPVVAAIYNQVYNQVSFIKPTPHPRFEGSI